jgi:N-acetyltransferase 10
MRKVSKRLVDIQKEAISASLPAAAEPAGPIISQVKTDWRPVEASMGDELEEAGDEVTKALREKQREMINSLDISRCVGRICYLFLDFIAY